MNLWVSDKYLWKKSFGDVKTSSSASWCWRGILSLRPKVLPYIRHLIGDGRATKFWLDPWLQDGRIKDLFPFRIIYDLCMGESIHVSQFISPRGWLLPLPTSRDLITLWGKIQNDIQHEPSFPD